MGRQTWVLKMGSKVKMPAQKRERRSMKSAFSGANMALEGSGIATVEKLIVLKKILFCKSSREVATLWNPRQVRKPGYPSKLTACRTG
jgi:hypothetical protein